MTSRERILAAFRNEERDRVGWCPELNDRLVDRELERAGKTPPPDCPDRAAWKYGVANELIGAVIWLASGAASFVTGIVVPIDGGFNAYSGV